MIKLALERITLGGRVWLDGYIRLEEQPIEVTGANVPVDSVHLYAKDNGGGISRLFYKDDGQVEHEVVTSGSGGGGVTDHGALTGLLDDDHPQYRLEADDHTHQSTGLQGGQLDHGLALTGLLDDDHTQYLLASAATDRATFAANWTDLTDTGATTLHSHAGGLTGSGTAGRVAFWDGAASLSSDADFTFSTDTLSIANITLPSPSSTAAIIRAGSSTLLHAFGTDSVFVGVQCGNLTQSVGYNTGIGQEVLKSLTSGDSNEAMGRWALKACTTGSSNVAIGLDACVALTEGTSNIAIGESALRTVTTGDFNISIGRASLTALTPDAQQIIAIGSLALSVLTTGPFCTAIGYSALSSMTTGGYSTAIGNAALKLATGDENTAIGYTAGQTITSGTGNICIGSSADVTTGTVARGIAIGTDAKVASSNYMQLGDAAICVGIAGAAKPTTGTKGLIFGDGTALSSMASNTAGLYADDIGGTVTMFNIAEDGRIKDLLWPRVARCGTQFDKANATLADVTDLTHTLAAAITYEFEAILHVDASLVGGSKFAMTGDGVLSATSITYHIDLLDNTTNAHTITSRQTALAGAAGQAGTTAGMCRISGTIVVNAAGALRVQFAQNAANGTSSVLVNSSFTVRKLD